MGKRYILHVDIDAFFAAVEVLLNPSLKGKPVIVGGLPHERGVASTASYEARKYGVRSGMPLGKARRLCPGGIFLRGNFQVYQAFSRRFIQVLSRFTPDVEAASLDEAYLDLTRCGRLYPSFSRAAREIKASVEKELGLAVSVGAGPNKGLAKLATGKAKPGGLEEIPSGQEDGFLKGLDIEQLPGIGPKARTIMHMLNVRKIGDLRALPRAALRSLFGLNGEEIYLQARGLDRRPVSRHDAPKSISRETTFLQDLWEHRLLLAHLAYLCDRMSLGLRKEGLFAHIIEVKLRWSDFRTESRRRLLAEPVREMGDIFRTARQLFSGLHAGSRLSLRLVGVKGSDLVRHKPLSLFKPYFSRGERLGSAVSQVRERYGFGSLVTVREKMLEDLYDFTPERGYVLKTASLNR